MSFTDIFITEDDGNEWDDEVQSLSQTPSKQIRVVIQGTVESQNELGNSEEVSEPEKDNEMTLKQGESDPEPFTISVEDLLFHPDDLLPPVVKLEKYATSELVFNRQVVARNLLETLRLVQGNQDDVTRVINVLCSISEDYDPSVRTDLMVQLPHIAAFCKETDVELDSTFQQCLVPMLINYLGEGNNQVRRSSHSVLLTLIEQHLIDYEPIIKKICPFVIHLIDSLHHEELRMECIVLMSKLSVLLGKEVTEEMFLDHLFYLCADKANNIRKACASTFGDFCTVVGRDTTEKLLLPKFFTLCEDIAWCVRKACTENFMPVSCVVSRETRCKELASLYIVLLSDQSRWVRLTAYQALGPFISTFAEPEKTGLHYSKTGVLTVYDINSSPVQNQLPQELSVELKNINGELENEASETVKYVNHSSLDRTTSSNSCDSLVPLNNVEASLTAAEVPAITCHVGSNYRTVIEVCSPAMTSPSACSNQQHESAPSNGSPSDNGINWDDEEESPSADSPLSKTQNTNKKERWIAQKSYGKLVLCDSSDDATLENGDLSSTVDEGRDCDSSALQILCAELETTLLSSITVNGINISSSVALAGATKYEAMPCAPHSDTSEVSESHQSLTENEAQLDLLTHSTGSKLSEIQDVPCKISSFENRGGALSEGSHCDSPPERTPEDSVELNDGSFLDESAFNYFQYWRTPLPDIDAALVDMSDSMDSPKWRPHEMFGFVSCVRPPAKKPSVIEFQKFKSDESFLGKDSRSSENKEGEPPPGSNQISIHEQDIVPPELLSRYLSMIDANWAQTIDAEIGRHCAYSLPAVALTLGRKYWPCLKDAFDALSSDLQGFIMMWKVRRTVASSMHQLAVILGPEITTRDLLPVFSRFINDLDEVRIGILQHISEFLMVLRPEERMKFLPSLGQFLVSNSDTDSNEKNWRFRLILAEQLVVIADLYEPKDVREYLVPLTLTLIRDKICEVRLAAVRVMAAVMRRMSQFPTADLTKAVLSELTDKFIHAPKWLHRQLYVYICQEFVTEKSLPPDQFAEDALPHLLYLCWDRIPNVRIAIARCLSVVVWPLETFSSPDSPHRELLLQTIHTLQSDSDADVRFYANMVSTHECSCLQHREFTNLGELPV